MPDKRSGPAGDRAAVESLLNDTTTVRATSDDRHDDTGGDSYGTSAVKRSRRTRAELAELDEAILAVAEAERPLTVRGVFYRVMSLGIVPKTEKSYSAVQRRALALRRAGRLPYAWIADGTRWRAKPTTWSSVDRMLDNAAASYRRALWDDQGDYVEVWCEKDAMRGVIAPVTARWDVPLLVARGFASESFLWSTAQEINDTSKVDAYVYQLGDHDPSGVAAWEHTKTKLREFVHPDVEMHFVRLAVTEEQITELSLPTRPTKSTDSRAGGFVGESVEVDAIPTSTLRGIVESAIESHVDPESMALTEYYERQERAFLTSLAGRGWSA